MGKEDTNQHKRWNQRDNKWVIGILIAVIILILTFRIGDNVEVINLFSFISSSVSIALASIAIFIALKQDTDNRRVNEDTSKMLLEIKHNIGSVDETVRRIDDNTLKQFANKGFYKIRDKMEQKDNFSKNEMLSYLNSYKNEITKELKHYNDLPISKDIDIVDNKEIITNDQKLNENMKRLKSIINSLEGNMVKYRLEGTTKFTQDTLKNCVINQIDNSIKIDIFMIENVVTTLDVTDISFAEYDDRTDIWIYGNKTNRFNINL